MPRTSMKDVLPWSPDEWLKSLQPEYVVLNDKCRYCGHYEGEHRERCWGVNAVGELATGCDCRRMH